MECKVSVGYLRLSPKNQPKNNKNQEGKKKKITRGRAGGGRGSSDQELRIVGACPRDAASLEGQMAVVEPGVLRDKCSQAAEFINSDQDPPASGCLCFLGDGKRSRATARHYGVCC